MGDVTLGDGPPTLGYQAFGFKGYYPSYLDLKVPASSSLTADTTFMFYLYLESNTAGTLFHFESDDAAASDAWTGVTVSYSSTAVMFNFYGDASSYSDESSSVALSLPTGSYTLNCTVPQNSLKLNVLSNFNGVNIFGTIEICSRHG